MKKSLLSLILLALAANPTFAQDANFDSAHAFYLGAGTGADLPGSQWNSDYYIGGGAQVLAGYELDPNWAAQLNLEQWFFIGGSDSLYNLRALFEAKYSFAGQGWQPYLLAGAGPIFQALYPSGDSTANFDALVGAGLQFDLAPRTHWYLEAKYNFIVSQTTTFTDLPVSTGVWVGL